MNGLVVTEFISYILNWYVFRIVKLIDAYAMVSYEDVSEFIIIPFAVDGIISPVIVMLVI